MIQLTPTLAFDQPDETFTVLIDTATGDEIVVPTEDLFGLESAVHQARTGQPIPPSQAGDPDHLEDDPRPLEVP